MGDELVYADGRKEGRAERHDEATILLSQFLRKATNSKRIGEMCRLCEKVPTFALWLIRTFSVTTKIGDLGET